MKQENFADILSEKRIESRRLRPVNQTVNLYPVAVERPDDVERLQNLYNVWKATHPPTPWRLNAAAWDEP